MATGNLAKDAGLREAEAWFLGGAWGSGLTALVPSQTLHEVDGALRDVADRHALSDLLPYVLDPHGEGSRLSVMLRPETAKARTRKREEGVFYTPADVASFMARGVVRGLTESAGPLTMLDPACGSGVFLRAVLAELRRRDPASDSFEVACACLYGTDVDPWALDAAALVLLADCMPAVRLQGIAPIAAWHCLRLNFAHVNALRLEPGRKVAVDQPTLISRKGCRENLRAGALPATPGPAFAAGPLPLDALFPELGEGARIVLGNPPYANVGTGNDLLSLSKRFETFQAAPRPTSDLYPLFVEQMIRLAAPSAQGGAMVLPLSIACNTGRQFLGLRRLIARTAGQWRFAFFDREPHALFGEEVKTRNAIVLWTKQTENDAQLLTGPLRKWRGGSRARMLDSVEFTPIACDIRLGIPKIHGPLQAQALSRLALEPTTLRHEVRHVGRASLQEAMQGDAATVYVAATAYNFMSVFLRPEASHVGGAELTENPLLALACPTREAALQVFAVLSSTLAFWWWHVHGDGFHVSKHVIESLPVGRTLRDGDASAELTRLGGALWEEISLRPVLSRNKGRTSLGFTAAGAPQRRQIDALLLELLGVQASFANELERFCRNVTSARIPDVTKENNEEEDAA